MEKDSYQRLKTSFLFLLLSLASITYATYAWFSIADNARVKNISFNITSGNSMRFDLDSHSTFMEYEKTLSFGQISNRIQEEKGFDLLEVPLSPVTTQDVKTFTKEDGTEVEDTAGDYLTFTLHFIGKEDMIVHLTSLSSENQNGTKISSSNPDLPNAMRISFEADEKVYVYDSGIGDTSSLNGVVKTFGLPEEANMTLNENNAMFSLKKEEDKEVLVHVWLEGEDESCTNDVQEADYSIELRFEGVDRNNNPVENSTSSNTQDDGQKYYSQREESADEEQKRETKSWWRKFLNFFTGFFFIKS